MPSPHAGSPGVEPEARSTAQVAETSVIHEGSFVRSWTLTMGLALLGGTAAWIVGELALDYFKPSEAASSQRFDFTALNKEMAVVSSYNGAVAFGALGGLVGLALGLAGGLTRRSRSAALLGGTVGLVLGASAGVLPSLAIMPWQWRHRNDDPSSTQLLMPMLIHFGLWCGVGLAGGLAFALGTGARKPLRLADAAITGLIGAIVGTFVFELAGALLFPLASTAQPFSATSITRLLARLCVAGFVAVGVIRSLPSSTRKTVETSA